jgi:hypothetical protein
MSQTLEPALGGDDCLQCGTPCLPGQGFIRGPSGWVIHFACVPEWRRTHKGQEAPA